LHDANDADNFLSFLKELRQDDAGKNLTVTVAATKPWLDKNGVPLTDVSEFAAVIDYVAIMNYDVWGLWSPFVGPNSPLRDDCEPQPGLGSALSFVTEWVNAKMPRDKIVLGIPSYGHSYRVRNASATNTDGSLASFPPFDKNDQPPGDIWDSTQGELDVCGSPTVTGGIIQFWGMTSLGYLDKAGNPLIGPESNLKYRFDNCSQTVCIPIQFEAPELIWLTAFHIQSVD
jgi:chitinase